MLKDSRANKLFMLVVLCCLAVAFGATKAWQHHDFKQVDQGEFSFSEDSSLTISTITQDVSIMIDPSASKGSASVKGDRGLSVRTNGNETEISFPKKTGMFSFLSGPTSRVIVTIPVDTFKALQISTVTGDIDIAADLSPMSFELNTTNGDIDFLNLRAENQAEIHSTTGSIAGYTIKSDGTCTIKTTGGDIDIASIEAADIDLSTVNTDIETTVGIEGKGSLKATSTNGDIELDFIDGDDLDITATTIIGVISFNGDDQDGKKVAATTGDGTVPVRLNSVNGDIELDY